MINPVFIPMESLEAEEDNEPPSLENRHGLFACPCGCMDSPAFGLTSTPQSIQQNSFYTGTNLSRNINQRRRCCITLRNAIGKVLTFFPLSSYSG